MRRDPSESRLDEDFSHSQSFTSSGAQQSRLCDALLTILLAWFPISASNRCPRASNRDVQICDTKRSTSTSHPTAQHQQAALQPVSSGMLRFN